jgi:hypothetical protein
VPDHNLATDGRARGGDEGRNIERLTPVSPLRHGAVWWPAETFPTIARIPRHDDD